MFLGSIFTIQYLDRMDELTERRRTKYNVERYDEVAYCLKMKDSNDDNT